MGGREGRVWISKPYWQLCGFQHRWQQVSTGNTHPLSKSEDIHSEVHDARRIRPGKMEGRLRLFSACPSEEAHQIPIQTCQAKETRRLTMATKTQFRLKGKSRDSYMELVLDFPLASIKSDEHLAEAQRVIDGLLIRGTLDEGEATYLDALSDLVGSWEDEHHGIDPASDADMLRHLMEAKGVNQMQLSRDTGLPKSTISEVLAGKKSFSRQIIRKLAEYFHVNVGVLAANI
jgi:HTH-type transcriptional regulator/antitoxin HigA